MGADLYIRKITETETDSAWNSSTGYFRDSYNHSSVLWTLGLSWWQDVASMLNDRSELEGDNLVKFRNMVKDAAQHFPETLKDLQLKNLSAEGENPIQSWHDYYVSQKILLLAFLGRAIELNTGIDCSL
jgi:hypothetical protein